MNLRRVFLNLKRMKNPNLQDKINHKNYTVIMLNKFKLWVQKIHLLEACSRLQLKHYKDQEDFINLFKTKGNKLNKMNNSIEIQPKQSQTHLIKNQILILTLNQKCLKLLMKQKLRRVFRQRKTKFLQSKDKVHVNPKIQ